MSTSAAALALLAAAAAPFDLPPLPGPDEGFAALWEWLATVNSELSIPDADFRWKFGGFSIPILGVFELVGIRRDWKLYPFLVPFWLIFGSVAFGVVGGLAATAAHLVLFPIGRVAFAIRDRRRAAGAAASAPAGAPARPPALATPPPASRAPSAAAPPPGTRPARDVLRAALEALRAAAEERRGAGPAPGVRAAQAPEPTWGAILRALAAALGAAAARGAEARAPGRPPARAPQAPAAQAPERPSAPTGASPGKPDFSAFRPDPARFRRRPPKA